jgi:hypothetical protein
MVWTRRGQAVTLALLALFGVASAVAAPAYLLATNRAVAAGQIATATPAELGLVIRGGQDVRNDSGAPDFAGVGAALIALPGFRYVYSAEFPAIGIEPTEQRASRIVFRQDVCAHLRIVAGRCLIGEGEVVIGSRTAERLKLAAGDPVTLTAAVFNNDPRRPLYLPDGRPKQLSVAGVYTVPDTAESFWGSHGYFATVPDRPPGEPLFTGAATMTTMDHGVTEMAIDGTAGPAALDIDGLPALRAGLVDLKATSSKLGASVQVTTGIPTLLDRIDAGRAAARVLVPVLAVPLVLLASFSIFLAVSYGAQGRQPELAVVALRGARWWHRWWLATGESLIAILAGALAGCLVGQLLVNVVAAARFPGVGADADWSSLRYAPLAAGAALAAAALAQRRQLLSPVAALLRRNPVTGNGLRAFFVEALVVLLAVISAAQLAISGGELTGLGLLAPALVILALALIAARALLPLVTRLAGRALAGGRPSLALAGFQLARRPGAQRLFALLVATVAVAGYAAAAVDVAAGGRAVQAGLGVGADRVIDLEPLPRSRLLATVRRIDPDGRFAMAATRLLSADTSNARGLAVDATRLAAVANWPAGALPAGEVADRLRPPTAEPVVIAGRDLTVDATTTGFAKGVSLRLNVAVSSLTGLGDSVVNLGELSDGRQRYQQRVEICRDGCRLNGIELQSLNATVGIVGRVELNSVGTVNPVTALPAAELADPARWRMPLAGALATGPDGLRIDVNGPSGLPGGAWIHPTSALWPLPAAGAGPMPAGDTVSGLDGRPALLTRTASLPAVPVLGERGLLVDLEYADRLTVDAGQAVRPQVWLNAQAPPDILDRLAAEGLGVLGDTRAELIGRQLAEQGPALAVGFHVLAGALAVLLGAGALVLAAAVDRTRRVEDLSALRTQGLSRAAVRRATLGTYPVLVAIAAVMGGLTAVAAWGVTGWALPLAGVNPPLLPLPSWPAPLVVPAVTLAVLALLAAVAAATGRHLYRRIQRGSA